MSKPNAYLMNSLKAHRSLLLKERRLLMARYASMERMGHPDKSAQGRMLELNHKIIALVEAAMDNENTATAELAAAIQKRKERRGDAA